jgi:hypothetical protein
MQSYKEKNRKRLGVIGALLIVAISFFVGYWAGSFYDSILESLNQAGTR